MNKILMQDETQEGTEEKTEGTEGTEEKTEGESKEEGTEGQAE